MSLLIVDETKCRQDGFCANDCPRALIRLKVKQSYPELVPGGDQDCIICGHCVAVCPHGAMRHAKIPFEDFPLIQKELVINEAQAVQFLRSRRSIRLFKDRPVEKEKIRNLTYCPKAIRWPPCTKTTCPVIQPACSEAKNITALAISSGRPTRRNGISGISVCSISAVI